MKESNYYTENQGMMLSAMNAVTIWAIEQSISPNAVKTGEASQTQSNYVLVVDNKDTLGKMGSLIEGIRNYLGIIRATKNIDALFSDIKYIAYHEARKLNYGCGDIIRVTLFMNKFRYPNNFVYYDYKGYMIGYGKFITSSNYFERINVISHNGCDIHNPYFSTPVLKQGI